MTHKTKTVQLNRSELPISLEEIVGRTPPRHFTLGTNANRTFVEVVDESNTKIAINDLRIAYLALTSAGKIETIKELQRTFRLKVDFKDHPYAREAALSGYFIEAQNISAKAQKFDIFNPAEIISLFGFIESLSGTPPDSRIHNILLSLIPDLDMGINHLARRAGSYLKYMIKTGNSPDHATVQRIYYAASSNIRTEFIRRVSRLYEITGISPELEGRAVSVEEYVRQEIQLMKDDLTKRIFDKEKPTYHDLKLFATRYPEKLIELLGIGMQEDYSYSAIDKAISILCASAQNNVSIPQEISSAIPRYFIAAGLKVENNSTGMYEIERVIRCLDICAQNGIWRPKETECEHLVKDGVMIVYQKVDSGEWIPNLDNKWDMSFADYAIQKKIRLLRKIASSAGIVLGEYDALLTQAGQKIRQAYRNQTYARDTQ